MRRVFAAPDFRAGFVEMLPASLGLIPFGLVCGVGAAAAGADLIGAIGMSAIIFSGAAQILASQLLAAGAPVAVVVLTCVGARLALPDVQRGDGAALKTLSAPWQRAIAFLLTDQAFAAVDPQLRFARRPARGRAALPGRRDGAVGVRGRSTT